MSIFSIVPLEVCMDDRLTKMQLKVLITLLSFRSKNSDTVWPSRNSLSKRCGYSPASISRVTSQLVSLGWLEKEGKGGYSKSCKYKITVPELVTVNEQTTMPEPVTRVVTEPDTITVTEPVTRIEQTNEHTNYQTNRRLYLITIDKYISNCQQDGVDAIPADDPIFEYAAKTRIPTDYIFLNWRFFVRSNQESGKKYKDWKAAFRNSVRGRWYNLWWHDNNKECLLTANGRQAQMEFNQ